MMTGGSTGGHINPAIAIADNIKDHDPSADITFVGTSKGMENRLVPRAGYPLEHIEIQGLKRSLSLSNIKTAYLTLTSVFRAKKLLKISRRILLLLFRWKFPVLSSYAASTS